MLGCVGDGHAGTCYEMATDISTMRTLVSEPTSNCSSAGSPRYVQAKTLSLPVEQEMLAI